MKKPLIFLFILITFFSCKKKEEDTNSTDWSGTYSKTSEKVSVPEYQGSSVSSISLPSDQSFTIGSQTLNSFVDVNVSIAIDGKGLNAVISSDPMSQHDNADGYNSWDFLGGSIKKNLNTLTFTYTFAKYDTAGRYIAKPAFTVVYQN